MRDGSEQGQSRLLLSTLRTLTVLAMISATVTSFLGDLPGAFVALGAGVLVFGLSLAVARGGRRATLLGTHGIGFVGLAATSALAVLQDGGLSAAGVVLWPMLPVTVAYLLGWRHALPWGFIVMATAVAFYLLHPVLPPVGLPEGSRLVIRIVTLLISVVLGLAVTRGFGRAVESRERHLVQARQQAELARERAERALEEAERARDRAELANRAKSTFLATMSHEIRTPLTAVVGLAEALRATAHEDDARRLDQLHAAGRTVVGLVDDVLDLARIEAGQLELGTEPVQLKRLLEEVAGIVAVRAQDKGVVLHTAVDGPPYVQSDALRLRQVLLNLAGNAVKFTEEGQVRLAARVRPRDDEKVDVRLTVEDTGVGIPDARMAAIFNPFVQAEQGTARRFGGSGLGLSIVSRLVTLMGGTIDLESEVGRGTRVTVVLPMLPADRTEVDEPDTDALPELPTHVLLAEDNAVNREVLGWMLDQLGCTVTVADSGFTAVAAVLAAEPKHELVLMDCQMPGMDGFQATRTLRSAGFDGPVVALTANATPNDRLACEEAGMDDFATKPITLPELRRVLARAVHRRQGRQS